ncbi:HAMP domain-containing sensor histidine kinase [Nocardioides psychrotolerans]|uniref:sensor histidine kinase n=1 Tax=Nocardioides psychrotolerans TaxID=1005945 RepID=UPI003137F00D
MGEALRPRTLLGRRPGGLRLRTSAAATVVVALVLAAASLAFVLLQRHQLESSLSDVARQQASDIAAQVGLEGTQVDLVGGGGDQSLVQVVNVDRTVVAASSSVTGEPPVVALFPEPGDVVTLTSARLPIGEGEDFVVVAEGVDGPDGPMVVLAAQSLETVQESTAIVGRLLAFGSPLVLLAVALTMYWLTGRALAPVEAMRRQVATIDGTATLAARVPVPPGGDEITRLARTMNSMLDRLQNAADTQRRFVGDASHELRSPLATIRAAHEIQALHPDSADWTTTSAEVLAELDRVDRLVADLLLLARSDEHGLALRVQDVDLDDLVLAEASRLRRDGRLEVVVSAPPVRVRADEHHLARALRNLTDNAQRHASSRVELTLSTRGDVARIEVVDDGSGVRLADRERIFERFVRLDSSRARDSGGTGLGLPIARHIARAHGGDLICGEARSGGPCFLLTVPRTLDTENEALP